MADRCAGCTNKFKFREKPAICAKCGRNFCILCIPKSKHKKKTPAVRETCIYCTRRLQDAMKEQEAVVLEAFPDRFYNSPHLQPQLHTKLRLNEQPGSGSGGAGGNSHTGPVLSEEDRKLEERLRKLKESHKPRTPVNTEADIKERLAKLRGEEQSKPGPPSLTDNHSGGGLPQPTNKTQVEQATDLVDEVSARVKLDAQTDPNSQPVEESFSALLSGMEIRIEDEEDPDKLLEDFKTFQAKQEQSALAEATSKDVQAMVLKARELHEQELNEESAPNTDSVSPYPQLPDTVTEPQEFKEVDQKEISKVLKSMQREIQQDDEKQRDIDQFMSQASKQLAELRGTTSETTSDSEVHSKIHKGGSQAPKLDFSWGHFGGQVASGVDQEPSTVGETAARQLGITLSNEVILGDDDGDDCEDDEVMDLIKKAMAEAALDRKLEEKGLNCYIKPDPVSSKRDQKGNSTDTSSSSGACAAATHYPSSFSSSASASGSRWEMDPDDLPWCCICNADAHIRCYDCDNDLYCTQCFSDGHQQFGLFDHKYAPFEPLTNRTI